MKELKCHRCNKYLGCIEKGKIKNGTIITCTECHESYKTFESLCKMRHEKAEMPEMFNEIFGKGFNKK